MAMLTLLSTAIARETQLRDRGPLVVSSSLAPDIQNNGTSLILLLHVTTSLPNDRETIRNLRLRWDQKEANEADVQVVSPPASIEELGIGRYFVWKEFAPDQTIKVLLRPHHILKLDMAANGFNQFELKISPAKSALPPLDLHSNRSN